MSFIRSHWQALIFLCLLIALVGAARWFGLSSYFQLAYIQEYRDKIHFFIAEHYALAIISYLLCYTLIVVCMLPVTLFVNMLAGYFFGLIPGTILSVLGATIGACCAFLWVRFMATGLLSTAYQTQIEKFKTLFNTHGPSYLLFMQLLPITPFAVITTVASLANVSLVTFAWTTAIGIIPGTFIYALIGQNFDHIQTAQNGVSWQLTGLFILLALLALLPVVIKKLASHSDSAGQ